MRGSTVDPRVPSGASPTVRRVAATESILSQHNVYAVFEAAEPMTGAPRLPGRTIPRFCWNINAEWAVPKNASTNIAPICFDCAAGSFGWVGPWVARQVEAHSVALLADNAPQSADAAKGFASAFKQFGSAATAQVVYEHTSLPIGGVDSSAQVSQTKGKGVALGRSVTALLDITPSTRDCRSFASACENATISI